MYDVNNVHILVYVLFGFVALFVGKLVAWMNTRLPEGKKIFSKEFFTENKNGLEKNYICMIIMVILYLLLLRKFGIGNTFMQNIDLIKFLILRIVFIFLLNLIFLLF